MTVKEIKEKYLQLFILVIEDAAESSGIEGFREVGKMFGENNLSILNTTRLEDVFDDDEVPFEVFVLLLVARVVIGLNGDDPEKVKSTTNMEERIEDIFQRYLIKPTHKFTSKYGIPTIKKVWDDKIEFELFKV